MTLREKFKEYFVFDADWFRTIIICRHWSCNGLCLSKAWWEGTDRKEISSLANGLVNAWKNYDNKELDIISNTGGEKHNSASLIARKTEFV